MPVKRKKKNEIDPWGMLKCFEDDQNFPLVIEEEDSYGNKRRMHLDGNMRLIPCISEKENNVSITFNSNFTQEVINKDTNKVSDKNKQTQKKDIITDENLFKSPIITKRKNKKVLITKETKNITPNAEKSLKSILKNVNVSNTPEPLKLNRLSEKMMFSSPIIKFSPSGINQTKEHKQMLLEKLQNCSETPILAPKNRQMEAIHNSIDYLKNDSKDSELRNDSVILIETAVNPERRASSSVLFPDIVSLELTDSNYKHNASLSLSNQSKSEASFKVINVEDRKKWLQLAKRRSRLIKRRQGLTDSFWHMYHVEDSLSVILKLCSVSEVQTFAKIFPIKARKDIVKLGEGSFGEVFLLKNSIDEEIVVKFIPVEGDSEYNGAPMNKYDDVLSEIVIAKELADLSLGRLNRCKNFVQMSSTNSVSVVRGRFPSYFQTEWDKANKKKPSENDNPKLLGSQQNWIVLQFHFAGCPLEDYSLRNWSEAYSILSQISLSLACAENHNEFEHRDLHLGNVLVLRLEDESVEEEETFMVGGEPITIAISGARATIIDFTFSRINTDGNIVYIDLSRDKDLFLGTGDIQFDVYRDMQSHNRDVWHLFDPKSNIFWLDYLATKMSEKLSQFDVSDDGQLEFIDFHNKIRLYNSAAELIRAIFL